MCTEERPVDGKLCPGFSRGWFAVLYRGHDTGKWRPKGPSLDRRARLRGILIALVPLILGCAHEQPRGRFLLHPLPTTGGGYTLSEGGILYQDKMVETEVRPLDQVLVNKRMDESGRANPFSAAGEVNAKLLVFEMRLKDRGSDSLYLNPSAVRGIDDQEERYLPLEVTDFYRIYRDDTRREERMRTFADLCFSTPVELRAGQEMKRYLALTSFVETAPKTLTLSIPLRYAGHQPVDLLFVFEAFPAEKQGTKPGSGSP